MTDLEEREREPFDYIAPWDKHMLCTLDQYVDYYVRKPLREAAEQLETLISYYAKKNTNDYGNSILCDIMSLQKMWRGEQE